jgi:hypothetical protein
MSLPSPLAWGAFALATVAFYASVLYAVNSISSSLSQLLPLLAQLVELASQKPKSATSNEGRDDPILQRAAAFQSIFDATLSRNKYLVSHPFVPPPGAFQQIAAKNKSEDVGNAAAVYLRFRTDSRDDRLLSGESIMSVDSTKPSSAARIGEKDAKEYPEVVVDVVLDFPASRVMALLGSTPSPIHSFKKLPSSFSDLEVIDDVTKVVEGCTPAGLKNLVSSRTFTSVVSQRWLDPTALCIMHHALDGYGDAHSGRLLEGLVVVRKLDNGRTRLTLSHHVDANINTFIMKRVVDFAAPVFPFAFVNEVVAALQSGFGLDDDAQFEPGMAVNVSNFGYRTSWQAREGEEERARKVASRKFVVARRSSGYAKKAKAVRRKSVVADRALPQEQKTMVESGNGEEALGGKLASSKDVASKVVGFIQHRLGHSPK